MKNRLFKILLFTFLLLFATFCIYKATDKQSKKIKAIDALGGTPAIAIKTNDFSVFYKFLKTECKTFQELDKTFKIENNIFIDKFTKDLLEFSVSSKEARHKSREVILSIEKKGNKLYQTCIIEFDNTSDCSNAISHINEKFSGTIKTNKREYKGINIYDLNDIDSNSIFFSSIHNLLIISSSSLGIEQSIDAQTSNQSLSAIDEGFNKIYLSSGKHEIANLFINLKELPNLLGCGAKEELRNKIKNFARWACLDISASSDLLVFNGLMYDQDAEFSFSKVLKSQKPQEFNSIEILPDKTAYYSCFAFNDSKAYNQQFSEYLSKTNSQQSIDREEELKKIESEKGVNLISTFYELIDNEICSSAINFTQKDSYDYFVILKLKSQASAIISIENFLKDISTSGNQNLSEYRSEIKISDKNNIPCYKLPIQNIPSLLFGSIFDKCQGKYVCLINNFMVFSDTKESLHDFAYYALLNRTLATNIEHKLFLEQFSSKSLMLFYFSIDKARHLLSEKSLPDSLSARINESINTGCKIGDIGFQINNIDNLLYNNIVIKSSKKEETSREAVKTKWESKLEAGISTKPAIVINHNNKEKEILVQDKKNNLYLLNNQGIELWRIRLNEQINSKIFQIDLFKNGKLQYLFSTENKLHLIDRLGNYLNKYPISLRTSSTCGMSLFDYEKNHNYRIIIACSDNKLYLYDGSGNIVKGWEFDKTERSVKSELSHYSISGEDFIVFHDKYKAYFLNRSGETKLEFQTNFEFSSNNKIWLDSSLDHKRFVTSDNEGIIRFFYTSGYQDSLKLSETSFSTDHFFALEDIDGDGKLDYIFADKNKLEVYSRNKKILISYNFEDAITAPPIFFKFSKNRAKIGIVCENINKIYIINEDGSLLNDFPLIGTSQFSIGNLYNINSGKYNLLVGGLENLLFNYEINTK